MKNIIHTLLVSFLLFSCASVYHSEQALNTGNYDEAINLALKELKNNKHKKNKQEFILILESAFRKAVSRDMERVAYLNKSNNPAEYEELFNLYNSMNNRQERIRPVLPLYIISPKRKAVFNFKNYTNELVSSKNNLSNFLYNNAKKLTKNPISKLAYRQAYDDFKYLEKINPNYKDTRKLMAIANQKGIDYIIVDVKNNSRKVIPKTLEKDLLNFSTYDINNLWTRYHNAKRNHIDYDFEMIINLKDILISPEQIKERVILKEKQIKDGTKNVIDTNGNVVKDSLGNAIKTDKFRKVVCEVTQFSQFKSVRVLGQVYFKNLNTKQLLDTFPLESEFVFNHEYATYNGDKQALDTDFLSLIRKRSVPFPTNEQMIFDSGEDLKKRLKEIISRQKF